MPIRAVHPHMIGGVPPVQTPQIPEKTAETTYVTQHPNNFVATALTAACGRFLEPQRPPATATREARIDDSHTARHQGQLQSFIGRFLRRAPHLIHGEASADTTDVAPITGNTLPVCHA